MLRKEVAFLNDKRLESFANQLEREDHPVVYPQLTCPWFIEGLNVCCKTWRYKSPAIGTVYHAKFRK